MSEALRRVIMTPTIGAALAIAITIVGAVATEFSLRNSDRVRFQSLALQVEHEIQYRMQTYVNTLWQTASAYRVATKVDRREFADYVNSLDLSERFPGIQGVGYAVRVRQTSVPSFEKTARREGIAGFNVWPKNGEETRFPIAYLEPLDWRNRRAIGYDMFTDPIRREAMDRAWRSGAPVSSGKVYLVQETDHDRQAGFLIYVPVYAKGSKVDTVDERRRHLEGFVYSPFRARDLFEGILAHHTRVNPVDFEVFLGPESEKNRIFDRNPAVTNAPETDLIRRSTFSIAGREWTLRVQPLPAFYEGAYRWFPLAILAFGVLFSGILFVLLRRNVLNRIADRERASQLEILNQTGKTLLSELEIEPLVQSVTDAGRKLSGAEFGAFFYNIPDEKGDFLTLYALSGAPKEAFSRYPVPRNTAIFAPTFKGEGTLRSDDIRKDPRYGRNPPYGGMPEGHLPVTSYLAVPVIGRGGEVLGGLFYGHPEVARFGEREAQLVEGLASQAAIAFENARLYQESKAAIRLRDDFLSIASHELKTPLTSLKLQLQLARRTMEAEKPPVPAPVARGVNLALSQVERLVSLVDALLDVSKINAGRLALHFERVNLAELAQEVADRFEGQVAKSGSTLSVDVPAEAFAWCDRFRMEQVLVNLLSNAVKYGSGCPIEIAVRSDGERARISVLDHGIGIPKEMFEKVFERFERAVSGTEIPGLGLGLYIAREIVAAHGGRIRVTSDGSQGTEFEVDLPVERPSVAGLRGEAAAEPAARARPIA